MPFKEFQDGHHLGYRNGMIEKFRFSMSPRYLPSCISSIRHSVREMSFKEFQNKGKRKVQGVPQSQNAALPRPQEEEQTEKSKQAQIEQTYEKH